MRVFEEALFGPTKEVQVHGGFVPLTIFGAASQAVLKPRALPAALGQIKFGLSKAVLERAVQQVLEMGFQQVAEMPRWCHKKIAGVDITVMFDGQVGATFFHQGAFRRGPIEIGVQD